MASTYTPLGIELQATGENAGTWGTKTNTNLSIIEQISGGYTTQDIAGGAQTTALSVSDGSTGAVMSHRMIEFTGSITGNQIVTIPLDAQNFYFLRNSTSGAYTVQFKYASGSGDTFTFTATNKSGAIVFATANDGTNPDIYTLPAGTGDVTFYAAFIGGNGDGTNAGDNYDNYQITVSEAINTAIHYNTNQNLILFNSITKTIELNDQTRTSIYNINGQLIFSSTEKQIDVSHLSQGNYIVKSANQTKKITIK